jgi:hypothetical protein
MTKDDKRARKARSRTGKCVPVFVRVGQVCYNIVAQNRPRYRYCRICRAEGRKTRATWICLECSNVGQRGVLVCEACLGR